MVGGEGGRQGGEYSTEVVLVLRGGWELTGWYRFSRAGLRLLGWRGMLRMGKWYVWSFFCTGWLVEGKRLELTSRWAQWIIKEVRNYAS